MRADHPVQGALGGEFVRRGHVRRAGHRRDPRGDLLAEPRRGVQAGADRGAAHRDYQQPGGGVLDFGDRVVQRAGVAGPFLPDGQRGGVFQVRPADLDHVGPLLRLGADGIPQPRQRRDRLGRGHRVRGDVHRGRERVVGRLAHVHMIVGVDRLLRAERAADQLDAPVGDDLVDVHVRLGARPGLPDIQRELGVQLAADHLIADPLDQLPLPGRQPPGRGVHHRGRLLHIPVRVVHLHRHPVVADVEVLQAALGLRAPVPVRGHLHIAQAVELAPHPGGVQPNRNVEDLRFFVVRPGHGAYSPNVWSGLTRPNRGRPAAISRPGRPAPGHRPSWSPRRRRPRPGPRRPRWSPRRRAGSAPRAAARRPAR